MPGEGILDGDAAFPGIADAAAEIRLAVRAHDDARGEGAVNQTWTLGRPVRVAGARADDLHFGCGVRGRVEDEDNVQVDRDRHAVIRRVIEGLVADDPHLPVLQQVDLVAAAPFAGGKQPGNVRRLGDDVASEILDPIDAGELDLRFAAKLANDVFIARAREDADPHVG